MIIQESLPELFRPCHKLSFSGPKKQKTKTKNIKYKYIYHDNENEYVDIGNDNNDKFKQIYTQNYSDVDKTKMCNNFKGMIKVLIECDFFEKKFINSFNKFKYKC